MRDLIVLETTQVSGANYGMCYIDDYAPNMSYITYTEPQKTPLSLILAEAFNAAFWGCTGALITGRGIPGCVIGGGVAAAGKTMSIVINDAHDLYWTHKSK